MAEPNPGLFQRLSAGGDAPYIGGFAITNDVAFPKTSRAINVGSGGTMTVLMADGTTPQLQVATGATIPIAATKVTSAGTSATGLVGLY